MNDKQILKCFEENVSVAASWKSWSPESKIDFCNLARIVHDAGFDWWQTGVDGEVARFGRKSLGKSRADFVIGIIKGKKIPNLRVHGLLKGIPSISRKPVTSFLNERLKKVFFSSKNALNKKHGKSSSIFGNWPNKYLTEASDISKKSEDMVREIDLLNKSDDELEKLAPKQLKKLYETSTTKMGKFRVGQHIFRNNVMVRAKSKCEITGVMDKRVLIASHIVAWKDCKSGEDRLDGNNGLLLTPNLDKLFDRGVISFDNDGNMLVNTDDNEKLLRKLLTDGANGIIRLLNELNEEQKIFLAKHRKKYKFKETDIFLSTLNMPRRFCISQPGKLLP